MQELQLANGVTIKVIAGHLAQNDCEIAGPIAGGVTAPFYFDIALPVQAACEIPVPALHNALLYCFEGTLSVNGAALPAATTAILSAGDTVQLVTLDSPARCLLIGGKPLNEPIVQYGPFVMNTRQEIEQAMQDYQAGRLTA